MQWLKIHDRKELYTRLVDKYEAKKFIEKVMEKEHVIKRSVCGINSKI